MVSKAQLLSLDELASMIDLPADSVNERMLQKGWEYLGNENLQMAYVIGDENYYESVSFNIHYKRAVFIAYFLPEKLAHRLIKSIRNYDFVDSVKINNNLFDTYKTEIAGKKVFVAISYGTFDGLSTILIEKRNQTDYYTLSQCIDLYYEGKYAEITPSLMSLKDTMETGQNFDEEKYFQVIMLLKNINTSYYNDLKQTAEILDNAVGVIYRYNGNKNTPQLRALVSALSETYYLMRDDFKTMMYIDRLEKLYQMENDFGDDYIMLQIRKANFCSQFPELKGITQDAIIEALKRYENLHGKIYESTDYFAFSILEHIGSIFIDLKDYDMSEKCLRHVVNNLKCETAREQECLNYACNNLCTIYIMQKRWSEASELINKIHTDNPLDYNSFLQNRVTINLFSGKPGKTAEYFDEYLTYLRHKYAKMFFEADVNRFENRWAESEIDIDYCNFVAYKSNDYDIKKKGYSNIPFFKTLSLDGFRLIEQFVQKSYDDSLKSLYSRCKTLRNDCIFKNNGDIDKAETQKKYELYYDSLLTRISGLNYYLSSDIPDFETIKKSLDVGEFVVEYCVIPKCDEYPAPDYYGAYVFGKGSQAPSVVLLGEKSIVDSLCGSSQKLDVEFVSSFYSNGNNRVYDLIFKPIEKYIESNGTIYYSCAGSLSMLNFDLLTDDNGTPLNQKYKMVRVSSTAEIPNARTANIKSASNAAVFGNIDYCTTPEQMQAAEAELALRDMKFRKLDATKSELDKISNILSSNHITVKTYEKQSANEKAFKQLSGNSPEIIHLATHGFCLDTDAKIATRPFAQNVNTYSEKESSMVLTGLALSGANNAWKGNFDLSDTQDDILTSYEISQLDLSNTRLAVLSACETAAGKVFPVDGVFGLQRAFKQAGAGSILMSLWKVDDEATAMFMESFYKFLFESGDRHKALRMAQDEVRKVYQYPWDWAAWVMLD